MKKSLFLAFFYFFLSGFIITGYCQSDGNFEQKGNYLIKKSTIQNKLLNPVKKIRYVTPNGTGSKNGSSWSNASNDLQAMINASVSEDEVWVATGTFLPKNYPVGCVGCSNNRDYAFLLKNGVAIYGGFKGVENNIADRNPQSRSNLSGNVGTTIDNKDNCYHVIISTNIYESTILDGFNISDGNANGFGSITISSKQFYRSNGGGIYLEKSEPRIENCKFISDTAKYGGAIYFNYSSPKISNCIFESNKAQEGGSLYLESGNPSFLNCYFNSNSAISGGALMNKNKFYSVFDGCKFHSNTSDEGGCVFNSNSSITEFINCDFNFNSSTNSGGVFLNYKSNPIIKNCYFSINSSSLTGGAITNYDNSSPEISNCIFNDNSSNDGGAIYNDLNSNPMIQKCDFNRNKAIESGGGIFNTHESSPKLINCILADNIASSQGGGMFNVKSCNPEITNSILYSNEAYLGGGGIFNSEKSNPIIINSLFTKNESIIGGGGVGNFNESDPLIENSIFWNNNSQIFNYSNSTPVIKYSIIEGGYLPCNNCPGSDGNIDPMFKNINKLKGSDGIPRTVDDGFTLLSESPAIDAGNPAVSTSESDITGFLRQIPFDLGPYEYSENLNDTCSISDNCKDIYITKTLFPKTGNDMDYVCLKGCLDFASAEKPSPPFCDFSKSATVWFAVATDSLADHLFTKVFSNSGLWQPKWAVYYGNCDSLNLAGYPSTPPCSNEDVTPEVHQTPVNQDNNINYYYIAVTYSSDNPPLNGDTGFTICAATIPDINICMGDIDDNNTPEESVVIKVIEREFNHLEPENNSETGYNGPFLKGEQVRVRIQFQYDATSSGADWLMRIVPDFGDGWDLDNFDFGSNLPVATPAGPSIFNAANTECAPQVSEYFPYLCTYYDDNGIFRLCNELGENCNCDKSYLDPLDPVPSGYFWISNGSSPGCVNTSCKPHERWGIGSTVSEMNWEFNIRVKNFASVEECFRNRDLQIGFQTFSDGGMGCWEDPISECLIDRKQFGPKWKAACGGLAVIKVLGIPKQSEICTGEEINVELLTSDGSDSTIQVFYIDNLNVSGEKTHVFYNGSGIIDDTLRIINPDVNTPQKVIYYAYVEISNSTTQTIDTFSVFVYPLPKIDKQSFIPEKCDSELPQNLKITGLSAYPGDLNYHWIDNLLGKSGNDSIITIDNTYGPGTHKFIVTLTDQLGCPSIDSLYYTIKTVDTTILKINNTLKAIQNDAQYQWLNCYAGYAKIIGETGQSFTPIINGSFAVEVTKDGCIDTSSCHKVIITGILENTFGDKLTVYPNPTDSKINIEFGETLNEIDLTVSDVIGKALLSEKYSNSSSINLSIIHPAGIYFIRIRSGDKYALVKVVKQ